ncbi:MBL fold metallo-hydrolase [Eubacteriales bacterium OttesenSCG-928-K08]|nr:MBL fold metallo-hydrolase [Eubacteriales bacterium OttesenSCG-928-K08]
MRIHIICNDIAQTDSLTAEHGFSAVVECNGHRVLFDTGDTDVFLKNAKAMGLSLDNINSVVLSHAHYDHSGGLLEFCGQAKNDYSLFLSQHFFTPKYWLEDGAYTYVGNNFTPELLAKRRIPFKLVAGGLYPLPNTQNMYLQSGYSLKTSFEQPTDKAMAYVCGKMQRDYFLEEMSLIVDTSEGLVVISGCSHLGVVNICEQASLALNKPVCAMIGGTHLIDANKAQLDKTIAYFNAHCEIKTLAAMHCTGEDALKTLEAECTAFFKAGVGSTLEFKD